VARVAPCSMANAPKWASMMRFPRRIIDRKAPPPAR
jgi:hypothetical protein